MTKKSVRVIDCHIAIRSDQGIRYLILKRSTNVKYPDHWQCVTGKINDSERPYHAAIREVVEETGLKPERLWTVDTVNFFYEHTTDEINIVPVFGMLVNNDTITLSHEHSEYCWCTIDKATSMLVWNKQIEGIIEFDRMLKEKTKKNQFLEISIAN